MQKSPDLVQKTVVDKNGVSRKVWVRTRKKWIETEGKSSGGHTEVRAQDTEEEAIQNVLDHPALSQSDKVRGLLALGLDNKKTIASLTGAAYSRVHQLSKKFKESGGVANKDVANKANSAGDRVEDKIPLLPKVDVSARWDSYELFSGMVVQGLRKSMIAYGTGGVGKTYTLNNKVLAGSGLKEYHEDFHQPANVGTTDDEELDAKSKDYDYIKITGKATPTALYQALYEHNDKLIIFDDCDSVLENDDAVNLLKGALDTTGDGAISYASKVAIKDSHGNKIPKRFSFGGRVVFISNLPPEKVPQPLRSRSLPVDLSMTASETIERLNQIKDKMPFEDSNGRAIEVSTEDRQAAVNLLDKYKDSVDIGDLNARTMGAIALVKRQVESSGSSLSWEQAALSLLTPKTR